MGGAIFSAPFYSFSFSFSLHLYRTARVHGAPRKQANKNRSVDSDKNTFGPANNIEAKPLQKTSFESLWYHHVSGER